MKSFCFTNYPEEQGKLCKLNYDLLLSFVAAVAVLTAKAAVGSRNLRIIQSQAPHANCLQASARKHGQWGS